MLTRLRRGIDRAGASVELARDEAGQMAFLMVLTVLIVFMFFGFSFDAGLSYFDHRTVQNQVDAGAHSGAVALSMNKAANTAELETAIRATLAKNGVASPETQSCAPSPTGWLSIADADGDPLQQFDRITVCLTRPTPAFFGGLVGITSTIVSAKATAIYYEEINRYAIMVMDPNDCRAFDVGGNADIRIIDADPNLEGGMTYTGANVPCGQGNLHVANNGRLEAAGHHVVGAGNWSGCGSCLIGPASSGHPAVDDPWGHLTQPTPAGSCTPFPSGGAPVTLSPGTYCSFSPPPNKRVDLNPGTYIVRGAISLSPNTGYIRGTGVTFYQTCASVSPCAGSSVANFNVNGAGGEITLSGSSANEGILFWIDRTSGATTPSINGSSSSVFNGHFYGLTTNLSVNGGSAGSYLDLNMTILANTIDFVGGARVRMNWTASSATKIQRVALIE